jgi:pyruvate/2-oxoglutarate dehydrogenase complex dihydrolipoamide acyltransferase (E2) component
MADELTEVILPKFGRMQQATISEWFKKVGDPVRKGEALFALETDKASQDVEAEVSGVLKEIQVPAGETVDVGTVIGLISGETESAPKPAAGSPEMRETASPPQADAPEVVERIRITGMRKAIAERMLASLQGSAQLTLTTEVDVTACQEKRPEGISVTAIVVQVAARALEEHPRLNGTLEEGEILLWERQDIGVAVDLDAGGLVVPVIRDAGSKSVSQINSEIKALAAKAQRGELSEAELTGATFTVTNLGMYGVDAFTPILDPPQIAILGVGRWIDKPGVAEGAVSVRKYASLSLTIDHRAVDGAPGARFLAEVSARLRSGDFK